MRIALQISGRLRYTAESIGSIMASIVEVHRPDVFCSFWNAENDATLKNWSGYLNPLLIETEDQSLIRPYLDELFQFNVHANMPSMSYKFHRVSAIRQAYERTNNVRYDVVIQARADNIFFEKLSVDMLSTASAIGIYCANDSINSTIDPYVRPRMVDNFYLGDPASIDLAASTFWHLRRQAQEYTAAGMLHHVRIPEIIQSKIWNDLGINIRPLPGNNPFGNFHYDIDRRDTPWR